MLAEPREQAPQAWAGRKTVSSIDRLRALPALFRGSDLTVRFQWDSKTASHYLWLWKRRGLVEALGGHADVFANLIVRSPPNWEAALLLARPSALIVGIECLRRAGWTTQIPARPEVAIDASLPLIGSDKFVIERRAQAWFDSVERGVVRERGSDAGDVMTRMLPFLKPAWALADLLARAGWGACGLAPDDIDWDVIDPRDRREWSRASRALDLPAGTAPELD